VKRRRRTAANALASRVPITQSIGVPSCESEVRLGPNRSLCGVVASMEDIGVADAVILTDPPLRAGLIAAVAKRGPVGPFVK
jgi:hypothetical protein